MNRKEILKKCYELADLYFPGSKYEDLYIKYYEAFYRGQPETCACILDEIEQYMRQEGEI